MWGVDWDTLVAIFSSWNSGWAENGLLPARACVDVVLECRLEQYCDTAIGARRRGTQELQIFLWLRQVEILAQDLLRLG